MKELAPYGQVLTSKASYEIVIIFMGKYAAERAADFQSHLPLTLYLPPQTSPTKFYWPLNNCYVYLVDTSFSKPSFIEFCALHFLSYGAKIVNYISASHSKEFIYE